MEFPHIGSNCSEKSCKQLDFLPVKCDACSLSFCREHYRYESHNCPNQYVRNKQVPVCPLCSRPIPLLPGEVADVKVGAHIDSDCQSDPARERRGKVYAHRCGVKGCKVKEVVPMLCKQCRQNYCLRHRHETDHSCTGLHGSDRSRSSSGAVALNSTKASAPATSTLSSGKSAAEKRGGGAGAPGMAAIGRELDMERQRRAEAAASAATRAASGAGTVQPSAGGASVSAVRAIQGSMTDEEALRLAMAASLQDSAGRDTGSEASRAAMAVQKLRVRRGKMPVDRTNFRFVALRTNSPRTSVGRITAGDLVGRKQEEQDMALARALAASEEDDARGRRQQQQQQQAASSDSSRCHVS